MPKLIYVIQEHHASHLHWDLRLEHNNALKSWAVPKVPKSEEKRLAIQVADHDKNYATFEGDIEEGYGKGSVKIWDSGEWIPDEINENKITGELKGKKLKGKFALIKFKDQETNWLFITP